MIDQDQLYIQNEGRRLLRRLHNGHVFWALSLIAFYGVWVVIFLVAKSAGGTYPQVLRFCLGFVMAICLAWGFAAASIFRKESNLLRENSNAGYSKRTTNTIAFCMLCSPLVMLLIFFFTFST
jgi:L-lactate permease